MTSIAGIIKELNSHRGRVVEIVSILRKYHLASWLNRVQHRDLPFFSHKEGKDYSQQPLGERMCMAFSEIGTTFIKLGQILSSRPDLIGEEACQSLSRLQNDAPTDSQAYIEGILKTLTQDKLESFDFTPLASGSIAQAHEAKYVDGTPLIIKIMHEGIQDKIRADLGILKSLAQLAEHFDTALKGYNPVLLVNSFADSLSSELDFSTEISHLTVFAQQFQHNEEVVFPVPYLDLSNKKVIAMNRIEGPTLSGLDYSDLEKEEKERLSFVIADTFFEMIFSNQFYHADPHAGNLIYTPENKIAIIDCGMVGRLSAHESSQIEDLMLAVVDQDVERLCRTIVQMGFTPKDLDFDAFVSDVEQLIQNYFMQEVDKIEMHAIVRDFNQILFTHRIVMSPSVSMLLRLLVILEGTTKKLDTQFSISELVKKYYLIIKLKRLDPKFLYAKSKKKINKWLHAAEDIPDTLLKFVKKLEQDDFSINMRHHNLSESIDKMVLALLTASFIVGSALVMSARIGPLIGDVSIIGLVGLCLSLPFVYKTLRRLKKK